MAVIDSTFSPALLGRSVVVTTIFHGVSIEHRGCVIGYLEALPGSRAVPSILLDQGQFDCEFFDCDEIQSIFVE